MLYDASSLVGMPMHIHCDSNSLFHMPPNTSTMSTSEFKHKSEHTKVIAAVLFVAYEKYR